MIQYLTPVTPQIAPRKKARDYLKLHFLAIGVIAKHVAEAKIQESRSGPDPSPNGWLRNRNIKAAGPLLAPYSA